MTVQHVILQHILNAPPVTPAPSLHVAIITDGNGRWATSRGLPRSAGHRAGAEAPGSQASRCPSISSPRPGNEQRRGIPLRLQMNALKAHFGALSRGFSQNTLAGVHGKWKVESGKWKVESGKWTH